MPQVEKYAKFVFKILKLEGVIIKKLFLNRKNCFTRFSFVLVVVLLSAVVLNCSDKNSGSNNFEMQIAMVDLSNQAFNNLSWAEYAELLAPQELEYFRAMVMPGIEKMILTSQTDSINLFGTNFHSETIQNESPADFFADIMNMTTNVSPELKATFSGMKNLSIGAVAEGDSLVHVVNRTNLNIGGQSITEMNVVTLKKIEGEWRLLLSPKVEGIAQMIRRGLPQ